LAYRVDAVHDELGVLVEVEAGRGAGQPVYLDLIRAALIVGAWSSARRDAGVPPSEPRSSC
jgi:hypothetical protein